MEPGAFRTSLTGEDKIRKAFTGAYARADNETKAVYGGNIATYVLRLLHASPIFFTPGLETVPRKIVHALFARYPNQRYIIGYDANTFFRVLSLLPPRVVDFLLGWPRPYGPRNKTLAALN